MYLSLRKTNINKALSINFDDGFEIRKPLDRFFISKVQFKFKHLYYYNHCYQHDNYVKQNVYGAVSFALLFLTHYARLKVQ